MSDAKAGALVSNQASPSVEELRRDQRQRWQQGERVSAEAYVAAYPVLQSDAPGMLGLVLHEVELRSERGETPQLDEYLARFPQLSDQLRQYFHGRLQQPGESLAQSFQLKATQTSEGPAEPIFQSLRQLTQWPTLPGYEILGVLGRGGMGVVYKAQQVRLKRLVAIKMILSGIHAGTEALARFRQEGEAVARLQHPNIVQIYEVGEQDGLPFFSLEFVDGTTLEKKLAKQPQPAQASAELLEILARAIHVAHQHHIVHRDLKPANVLINRDGVPKITDFGLAKQLEGEGLTVSDAIMGTPRYMAPEQAWGRVKDIGPHTDVYALGAILYEMLTGHPLFETGNVLDTIDLVRRKDPLPLRHWQPQIPPDLETICLKCLDKEIPRRYASALALADDLRRFLEHRPILARPTRLPERVAKWIRRRPLIAGLTGVIVLGMLTSLGAGAWLWQTRQQAQQEREAAQQEVARHEQTAAEAVREDVKDYAAFTNGKVILEPVGPALPEDQVRHRHVTFRFSRRGGRTEQVDVVNGHGQLTTQHPLGAFIDDLFDTSSIRRRECRYESERDERGRVIREVGRDRANQIVYRFQYDPDKNLGRFDNGAGFPLPRAGTGAAYVRFVWSENQLLKEMRYLDKDAKPSPGKDGTYGLRLDHNPHGLVEQVTLLDAQGQPMENRYGFARMTMAYNEHHQLIEKAFFDLANRPEPRFDDRYAKIRLAYDQYGNHSESTFFGLDGRPCLTKDGFARLTMAYDEHGNLVERAYYGLDGKPTPHRDGYARVLSRYDERGEEIETSYLSLEGQPIQNAEGFAKFIAGRDAYGNVSERTYYGLGGEQVRHRDGYAKLQTTHDAQGNCTVVAYLGIDDQLLVHRTEGYAQAKQAFDPLGNAMEVVYFGVDGKPALHRNGYARVTAEYDERGNSLEKCFFDGDGKAAVHSNGYAKVTSRYDAQGNLSEEAFWGPDGKPARHVLAGYARVIFKYDRTNHCIDVTYFDVVGQAVPAAVAVIDVLPGSKAEQLGLAPRDYLYMYDGKAILNTVRLKDEVARERPGDGPKKLRIIRFLKGVTLSVPPGWLHGVKLGDTVPRPWGKPQPGTVPTQ